MPSPAPHHTPLKWQVLATYRAFLETEPLTGPEPGTLYIEPPTMPQVMKAAAHKLGTTTEDCAKTEMVPTG